MVSRSKELLKERYFKHLKENPEMYVGIELEFPIVNKKGDAVDTEVTKGLLNHLAQLDNFRVEKRDVDGNAIQLVEEQSQDRILFEVSYTTIEFAFGKAVRIQEVEERFQGYITLIQEYLTPFQYAIEGHGIHPQWDKNSNEAVASPRYQMLMDYLALGEKLGISGLHAFSDYGAFICGSQVQLDVSRDNILRVINAFTQIEPAKAYLFAHSEFSGADWDTRISRDIFWEESMHGLYRENVGISDHLFVDQEDFLSYLDETAIFTAERDGQTYYFSPIRARNYLQQSQVEAYSLEGVVRFLSPQEKDFETHRSYHFQDLTTRGTVEFRSVCTQSLDRTFAPAAFHLGLLTNLANLEAYLAHASFFEEFGREYKKLRRQFSKKVLTKKEEEAIGLFTADLLELAVEGLQMRPYGEESYLDCFRSEK